MSGKKTITIDQAISKAKKAMKNGDIASAVQIYSNILNQDPKNKVVRKALRKIEKYNSNKTANRRALLIDPPQQEVDLLIRLMNLKSDLECEKKCEALLQSFSQSVVLLNVKAVIFSRRLNYKGALDILDDAIGLNEGYAASYNNRGLVYMEVGRTYDAIKEFKKAISLRSGFVEAYGNLGNALRETGEAIDAVLALDKAIELSGGIAELYNNKGIAMMHLGKIEEAKDCFNLSINNKPTLYSAYDHLSKIKRFEKSDTMIKQMNQFLADRNVSLTDQATLNFTLSKVYDDVKEYELSFNHLRRGNDIRKKILGFDFSKAISEFCLVKSMFSDRDLVGFRSNIINKNMLPIFVLGMPRSGTSLVEQILSSNSIVHGAGELRYVSEFLSKIMGKAKVAGNYFVGKGDVDGLQYNYFSSVNRSNIQSEVFIDKMPLNFRFIGFILAAFPRVKIIHMQRSVVATCWSIYKQNFKTVGNGFAFELNDLSEYYKLYTDLMAFWHDKFPGQIYDLNYEKLTENQEEETRKLLEYCGLPWEDACLEFHKNKRAVKTASATQVRKKMYTGSSEAWRKYEKYLQPLLSGLRKHGLIDEDGNSLIKTNPNAANGPEFV
jgi:tetratricopeptide (TPR) repeat protein